MRDFYLGAAAATVVLLAAAFLIYPQYSDYRAAAETSQWLAVAEMSMKPYIAEKAKRAKTLAGSGVGLPKPVFAVSNMPDLEITPDGMIFMRGGRDGQLVVLIPSLAEGKVTWRCVGGSRHDVTSECQTIR